MEKTTKKNSLKVTKCGKIIQDYQARIRFESFFKQQKYGSLFYNELAIKFIACGNIFFFDRY